MMQIRPRNDPVLSTEPGCELACARCPITCAVVVGARDDLWREVEGLRRQMSSRRPTELELERLALALGRLEEAERAVVRVRQRFADGPPPPTYRRTCQSTLLH